GEQLPKDNPHYQHALAKAYNNRGNALRDLRDFKAAVASYDQALAIGEQLPKENPQYQYALAWAYGNRAVAYLNLGKTEKANNDAEMGLDILCDLEKRGIYWFRATRETLFDITIDTYLALRSISLLDLLEEHLDPDEPGSAPQSEAMHAAALSGLQRLFLSVASTRPELVPQIFGTLAKLTQFRSRYFIGTAVGARLTAEFHEKNLGDLTKAEAVLRSYTEKVPSDPQGYTQLAEFLSPSTTD
ncbi:MAG: hypothetical protein BWK79_06845, partial [Beggiatoa sp. IS2]